MMWLEERRQLYLRAGTVGSLQESAGFATWRTLDLLRLAHLANGTFDPAESRAADVTESRCGTSGPLEEDAKSTSDCRFSIVLPEMSSRRPILPALAEMALRFLRSTHFPSKTTHSLSSGNGRKNTLKDNCFLETMRDFRKKLF